ncbi:MAG: hypothetical protein QM621_14915 [Aeromicrobium sp.]|uniref:hypothetical protein n=1 Tax=Aeromicrobium sp. TaxID=1871063 RepID=UPI0039E3F691
MSGAHPGRRCAAAAFRFHTAMLAFLDDVTGGTAFLRAVAAKHELLAAMRGERA